MRSLDAAFGEPRLLWDRLVHPAVVMGRLVGWCDHRFNRGQSLRASGIGVTLGLLAAGLLTGWVIQLNPGI